MKQKAICEEANVLEIFLSMYYSLFGLYWNDAACTKEWKCQASLRQLMCVYKCVEVWVLFVQVRIFSFSSFNLTGTFWQITVGVHFRFKTIWIFKTRVQVVERRDRAFVSKLIHLFRLLNFYHSLHINILNTVNMPF